jgi:NADH-quinone oxidoreductase subunit E
MNIRRPEDHAAGGAEHAAFEPELLARLERDAKEIIARYPKPRSALLPLLHLVQSEEGYVSDAGIQFCADQLGITPAQVTGVVTFYTQYKQHPVGEYHVGVCINSLCAIMGGDQIWDELSEYVGVGHDEPTDDGKVSLERIECNAACDYAPVMMVNWEFMDNMTPQSATQLVDDLRDGREVSSTRGPVIATWREVERVLAGFPDDRVDEGPGAGPASLVGLGIARDRGWSAPSADASGDTGSTADTPTEAAEQADTSRAETETKQQEGHDG